MFEKLRKKGNQKQERARKKRTRQNYLNTSAQVAGWLSRRILYKVEPGSIPLSLIFFRDLKSEKKEGKDGPAQLTIHRIQEMNDF